MHRQIYHVDERAREEAAAAAAERQVGCSPLGRMISKVIMKCNGREARMRNETRLDYAMACPPAQTCYARPTAARTVAYATSYNHPGNGHAIPPVPPQAHTPFVPTVVAPPRKKKKKKSNRVRFTPAAAGPVPAGPAPAGPAPPPHVAQAHQHAAAGTSSEAASGRDHHHYNTAVSEPYSASPQGQYGYGYGRYAASPLTRWEMLGAAGTPRRHEYFSSEYRWCYPTPVREGIYGIATDANRLTAIFSEENPNACAIV